ncbi:hypothetical protein BT96DRAFT_914203 [Gymnopus androsaceus JB14]|uniref:Chromatin remodeling factor mit1 n=1 Tax=Gymnopus androsaceus JB14 TaxID=1447944 RepID=A0A6A4IG86_9AGAR|nr:hypothetical protein BT96DRAFT_914203 [Gymnopus androsaceus JB14]
MAESEPEMVSVSPPENRFEIASSSDEKSTKNTKPRLLPYVSLPRLPETNKALYESLVPPLDKSIKVDEVVGEAVDDLMGPLYYGRFEKGINSRPQEFVQTYPDLIAAYDAKKEDGNLEPFDPSSAQVHPKWRIQFRLTINKRRASISASSAHGSQYSDESEVPESEEDPYSGEESERPATRRSLRHKTQSSTLPFSPRKTRSRTVYPVSDSEDDESNGPRTRRRSQRLKPTKIRLDDEDFSQSALSESDEYSVSTRGKASKGRENGKSKGRGGKKAYTGTKPEYGCFRSVDEFDEDPDPNTRELREHWLRCGKCHENPAHMLLQKETKRAKKGKRRKRNSDEEEEEDDEVERIKSKGGWVRCLKCPVSVHWSCLSRVDQEEILKAARERDRVEWLKEHEGEELSVEKDGPRKRPGLDINEMTDFICSYCTKGGVCMGCLEMVPGQSAQLNELSTSIEHAKDAEGDVQMEAASSGVPNTTAEVVQLLFRCFACKRLAHYQHIQDDIEDDLTTLASRYQSNWFCGDCSSYQSTQSNVLTLNIKEPLPREYLVKWQERGYRRTEWVPHMWLVSTNFSKLKNFTMNGTKVELLGGVPDDNLRREEEPSSIFDIPDDSSAKPSKPDVDSGSSLSALVDAEDRIPISWKTVDRVLDVQLRLNPSRAQPKSKQKRKGGRQKRLMVQSEDDESDESDSEDLTEAVRAAFDEGEEPVGFVESVDDFEVRTGEDFDPHKHIGLVIWAFFKWSDLGYEESTWDAPPRPMDATYPAFQEALIRFSVARKVQIPKYSAKEIAVIENRPKDKSVDGFNWLCKNWWNKQTCILADEMGLGKTVQITSFIGHIVQQFDNTGPALVVVPNSTITNWIREFERWAPKLRVVPFYGESKARDVVKKFELRHSEVASGTTGSKFHVLVTTYESLINPKDFGSVFKIHTVKSDSSLLFRKLNELTTGQRIIMTGTPLNNNMRELFNLMNFLDPANWNDLPALEREYADLDEDLVKQLHNLLRPYFLRRIKSEVLDLPPKNEVIVPLSMSSLQKEVYRSILSHNVELLQGLLQPTGPNPTTRKANINNMLMQLRKCLQHPYLYDEDIEPRHLSTEETHEKLISASAKLRLLRDLLPKLKARGHRVLIFSQFVIALNIIEDFLTGEGHKFLRLDGNTKGTDRQKGMDEFNRPNSDIFIYLLTTRAGSVGINLFTADTVIIFDPDFNPHQDLQAIARAHRFGQKKTCLVFKLVVKDSAEERIMQIGKKKLVLDHLIVQKMDDDDSAGENVQSILTYGAQRLDIVYSELDIDNLIAKTEKEGDEETAPKEGAAFSFAKIWTADKDELEEVADDDQFEVDSWAQTLQKINEERAKKQAQEEEESGRGSRRNVRRKAAAAINYAIDFDTPKKSRNRNSDGESVYGGSEHISDASGSSESEVDAVEVEDLAPEKNKKGKSKATLSSPFPATNVPPGLCGLCGQRHGPGNCPMTESSENLVEYREMLIMHTEDESYEHRCAAVNSIDEVLRRRGHERMIYGQPLYPVRAPRQAVPKTQTPAVTKKQGPTVAKFVHVSPAVSNNAGSSRQTAPAGPSRQVAPDAGPSGTSALVGLSTVHRNGVNPTGAGKRPSSPSSSEPSSKKPKQQIIPEETCAVCDGPLHKLKDCGVLNGPLDGLLRAANRLSTIPQMGQVAETLHRHHARRSQLERT